MSDEINFHNVLVKCVAVFLSIFAIGLNAYFVLEMRRAYFHFNMRFVLAMNSINLMVCQIFAIVNVVFWLSGHESYGYASGLIRDTALSVNTFSIIPLVVERIFASFASESYETHMKWLVCYFGLFTLGSVAMNFYSSIGTTKIYRIIVENPSEKVVAQNSRALQIYFTVFYAVGGIANLLSVIVFLLLCQVNIRRYERQKRSNLSYRYQLSENVRTGRQLIPVTILRMSMETFYGISLVCVLTQCVPPLAITCINLSYSILSAADAILTPFLCIWGHGQLRISFEKRFLQYVLRPPAVGPKTLSGTKMIVMDSQIEARMYFEELNRIWDGVR